MKKILSFLNPIAHFGDKNYSFYFPFIGTFLSVILVELYFYQIAKNPDGVGLAAIFIFISLIIYFSFREGIRGGFIATTITILYYFYIIYSRNYSGARLVSGIETTVILSILYFFLSFVIGWLKQIVDTLIEREADEKNRLLTIIEQLPVGIIITDNKGSVVQANKKIEAIIGTKIPCGFKIGKEKLMEYIYKGKYASPSDSPLAQSLATGKPVVGREFIIKRNGKNIYLHISAAPVLNNSKKVIAAASIVSDITEQKEMEEKKDDFVNMASHELKTPLTSMKLYIESLTRSIKKYNDTKSTRLLDNIKIQTERLQHLVNDLLDVSRLQTGKLTFNRETFNLNDLVTEIVEVLNGTENKKRLFFQSTRKSMRVNADRFRVYQVLTNLITNAMKYSDQSKPIHIKTEKESNKVIVSVKDKGIGISKYEQSKIFQRLYQVSDKHQKTFPGFGMGLFISKEIIKRHKGKIWLESEKGEGSTFYFSLPLE